MSLRQQAKILGISVTYLSLMKNGKRPWKPEIKARYDQLVNSLPESVYNSVYNQESQNPQNAPLQAQIKGMVGGTRVELVTSAMSTQRSKPLS